MNLRRDKQDSRDSAHALDPVTATGGGTRARDDEEPEATSPHASRFSFLTGVLVAFAMLTIFGAGMLASHENRADSLAVDLSWSAWQPTDKDPGGGSREIADRIGRQYKLGNHRQLVAVTGGPMEVQGLPINLALREPAADGGNIDLAPGDGVLYRMCGLGPNCSIDQGKPSKARELLLRRQALELAMYSFRYLKKTSNVVVFLPPGFSPKGVLQTNDHRALFFQESQLKRLVKQPLSRTLTQPPPTPTTMMKSKGATDIDQFTHLRTFNYSLTQANSETSVFLVLDPAVDEPAVAPAAKAPGKGRRPPSGSTGSAGTTGSGSSPASGATNGAPTIVQPLSPTAPG